MGPRFGPLYASAVLRPLAEQLVAELDVRPGDTACDLMCDSGALGAALGGAVGRLGSVLLVDTDKAVLAAAASDVAASGCAVSTALADARGIALAGAYDRVASLCTAGFWPAASLLTVAERLTRPGGIAALLTWDAAFPPPHEITLVDALRKEAGIHSRFLDQCLPAAAVTEQARWERSSIRDVVRFDGIAHYWAAMVVERPVAAELAGESDVTLSAIRAACERALHPFTAVDGTMRIPVVATLLRRRATDRA